MTYRTGLSRKDKVLVTMLAVVTFFLLYNEFFERITGEYGRWWDLIDKGDSEFTITKGDLKCQEMMKRR